MEIKTYKRLAKFVELKEFDSFAKDGDFIEVTEWYNGEGFDVSMTSCGREQFFQLTWGEYSALKKLVKAINKAAI